MAPNETTVLLTNYREKRIISPSSRNGYGLQHGANCKDENMHEHIVHVGKDPAEYEPIFSIDDYSSALSLAELLPFQDDPWWQKFRRILFLSFWLTLLMTFATACILSYLKAGQLSCQAVDPNMLISTTSLLTSTTAATTSSAAITTMSTVLSSKISIMPS